MEHTSAVPKEKDVNEAADLKEHQEPVRQFSPKPKKIGLIIMVGTGVVVGMMISIALGSSLIDPGGMLGGALTGLLIHYSS